MSEPGKVSEMRIPIDESAKQALLVSALAAFEISQYWSMVAVNIEPGSATGAVKVSAEYLAESWEQFSKKLTEAGNNGKAVYRA